ncbi:MAG: hypothetical protein ACRDDZ_09970 [Marinifilaceae bacterium]
MRLLNSLLAALCITTLWCTDACAGKKVMRELGNAKISRQFADGNILLTTRITNKLLNKEIIPTRGYEFCIRLSEGTDKENTDRLLTNADFKIKEVKQQVVDSTQTLSFYLVNKAEKLNVTVNYQLIGGQPYMRKWLEVTPTRPVTLERMDIESLNIEDSYQTYNIQAITSYLKGEGYWKPGLGMPIYTSCTGTFWGVEFPAATNSAVNQQLNAGYHYGQQLQAGETYTSHKSVVGVADNLDYIDDAFMAYINDIRIRPLRLQVQYNCFFDFGWGVNGDNFSQSVNTIHNELVTKRGVAPLDAYVIDDGWQDGKLPDIDQKGGVWSINNKFSPNFERCRALTAQKNSSLGLWLSPGCFFGSKQQIQVMRQKGGFEPLSLSMSMCGPNYMQKLEDRIIELTKQGITYFKYDGLFGHQYTRDFELNGRGTATMPQLNTEGFAANDVRLNNPKYDELKLYYLSAGTERLMQIFRKQHEVNPNVFTAITNGAYLSPWWLMYADVVWLINCGDAAGGSTRNDELVYRDGVYHEVFHTENTKFPINSIFNHEPKKTSTGESEKSFRDYLYMNLSRGACFIELYLKTKTLSPTDWDVLADGLKWAKNIFPTFQNVKMIGGNPRERVPYGYSGWTDSMGYISLHNPGNAERTFRVKLDRSIGTKPGTYKVSTPAHSDLTNLQTSYSYNDEISITLKPKEIKILTFTQ